MVLWKGSCINSCCPSDDSIACVTHTLPHFDFVNEDTGMAEVLHRECARREASVQFSFRRPVHFSRPLPMQPSSWFLHYFLISRIGLLIDYWPSSCGFVIDSYAIDIVGLFLRNLNSNNVWQQQQQKTPFHIAHSLWPRVGWCICK